MAIQRSLIDGSAVAVKTIDATGVSGDSSSYSLFTDFGANATAVVKASEGNLFSIQTYNENAAVRYLQIHNLSAVPTGGEVPVLSYPVPPSSGLTLNKDDFGSNGINFSTGISFAFSTTDATYTAGTASEQTTHIFYK